MNIKKVVKIIFTIIVLIAITLIVMYFIKSKKYAKTDETADLKEKVSQELHFLDDYLISMANSVNNINLENYIIKAETISGQSSQEDNGSESSSSSKTVGGESSGSEGNQGEDTASGYVLEPSDVLLNDRNPDWETLKISVERLYSIWPTILIDLYKLNVNNDDVQNFSRDLDILTNSIKAEDKKSTLTNISKLYDYLPSFGKSAFNNSLNNNMISTKANILKVYTLIEEQNWEEMKRYINDAQNEYNSILNNANNKNQYNVNKTNVILKEFQASIDAKNADVLYIKYKNLLDEINIIEI